MTTQVIFTIDKELKKKSHAQGPVFWPPILFSAQPSHACFRGWKNECGNSGNAVF